MKKLFLAITIVLCLCGHGWGATYHINKTASGDESGSDASNFMSRATFESSSFSSGDICIFYNDGGNYTDDLDLTANHAGITIISETAQLGSGGVPNFTGSRGITVAVDVDSVTVQDIDFNTTSNWIRWDVQATLSDWTIQDCEFGETVQPSQGAAGIAATGKVAITGLTIDGCTMYGDGSSSGTYDLIQFGWDSAVTESIFKNSYFGTAYHQDIAISPASNWYGTTSKIIVRNCIFENAEHTGVSFANNTSYDAAPVKYLCEDNVFMNIGQNSTYHTSTRDPGIQNYFDHGIIRNNTFDTCQRGILPSGVGHTHTRNIRIYNNTFYNMTDSSSNAGTIYNNDNAGQERTNMLVANNIFRLSASYDILLNWESGYKIKNNLFDGSSVIFKYNGETDYSVTAFNNNSSNDVTGNISGQPDFINEATDGDFHIGAESAARDAGAYLATISAVNNDTITVASGEEYSFYDGWGISGESPDEVYDDDGYHYTIKAGGITYGSATIQFDETVTQFTVGDTITVCNYYTAPDIGRYEYYDEPCEAPTYTSSSPDGIVEVANEGNLTYSVTGASDPNGGTLSYSWTIGGTEFATDASGTYTLPSTYNDDTWTVVCTIISDLCDLTTQTPPATVVVGTSANETATFGARTEDTYTVTVLDGYIYGGATTTAYGSDDRLYTKDSGGITSDRKSYVAIPTSDLAGAKTGTAASLFLNLRGAPLYANVTVEVYSCADAFTESATWNTYNGADAWTGTHGETTLLGSKSYTAGDESDENQYHEFTSAAMLTYVDGRIDNDAVCYFIIKQSAYTADFVSYWSEDYNSGASSPYLSYTYSGTAPDPDPPPTAGDIDFWWQCESTHAFSQGDKVGAATGSPAINTDADLVTGGTKGCDFDANEEYYTFVVSSDDIVDDSEGRIGFNLYINTFDNDAFLVQVRYDDENRFAIRLDGTDELNLRWIDSNNTRAEVTTTDANLSTSTKYFVEVAWKTGSGNYYQEIWVNDTSRASTTNQIENFATTPDELHIGYKAGDGDPSADFYIDNVIISKDKDLDLYQYRDTTRHPDCPYITHILPITPDGTYKESDTITALIRWSQQNQYTDDDTDTTKDFRAATNTAGTTLNLTVTSPNHATDAIDFVVSGTVAAGQSASDLTINSIDLNGDGVQGDIDILPSGENLADNAEIKIDTSATANPGEMTIGASYDGERDEGDLFRLELPFDGSDSHWVIDGPLTGIYITVPSKPDGFELYCIDGLGTTSWAMAAYVPPGERLAAASIETWTPEIKKRDDAIITDVAGNEISDYNATGAIPAPATSCFIAAEKDWNIGSEDSDDYATLELALAGLDHFVAGDTFHLSNEDHTLTSELNSGGTDITITDGTITGADVHAGAIRCEFK